MTAAGALARLYPAVLAAVLAAWALTVPAAAGRIRRKRTSGKTVYLLIAIVLGALAWRLAYAPVHRVYDDEFEHLDIARRLAATGVFAETTVGGLPGWDVMTRPTWPGGHHVGLAAAFSLFGAGESTAAIWSALLSALSVLFVFWAALEAFDDERGALAAAFVWGASPLLLTYALATDLTSSSVFWIAASLAALHACRNDASLNVFAAITLAYAVQVRPENILLVGYAALLRAPRAVWLPALIGFAVPAGIAFANRAEALPGYSAATTAPLSHLARQIGPNLRFLFGSAQFWPVLLPAGAAVLAFKRPALKLAALSAAFLLLYGCFFRGRFDAGTEDRYALSVLLPLSVAAAPLLSQAAVPAALLAAGLAWAGPAAPEPEHEAARRFLSGAAKLLPERAYIAAFNPPFAREVTGRPVAWAPLILEDLAGFEKNRARAGAAPELVLYKDWAWRSRPEEAAKLEKALAAGYEFTPVADNGLDSLVLLSPRLRGR